MWEDPGSNYAADGCLSWQLLQYTALGTGCALLLRCLSRLSKMTVKWVSAFELSNNNNGDGGCGWYSSQLSAAQPKSIGCAKCTTTTSRRCEWDDGRNITFLILIYSKFVQIPFTSIGHTIPIVIWVCCRKWSTWDCGGLVEQTNAVATENKTLETILAANFQKSGNKLEILHAFDYISLFSYYPNNNLDFRKL